MPPSRALIASGIDVTSSAFPFVARIYADGGDNVGFCGGSLIDERHVLTAAHCVTESVLLGVPLFVGLGKDHVTRDAQGDGEVIAVRSATSHPAYNHTRPAAIVFLPPPACWSTSARSMADSARSWLPDLLPPRRSCPGICVTLNSTGAFTSQPTAYVIDAKT